MRITIIGQWGAYPEVNSATTSFLIEEQGYNILIECGCGVFSTLQRYLSPDELNALIVSHYHKDHVSDIGCLQYYFQVQNQLGNVNNTFPIYGHNNELDQFNSLSYKDYTKGIAINNENNIEVGPFKVSFCPTIHPVFNLAMRLKVTNKVVVYTGDTEWCEPLVDFSKNADILISEANLYNDSLGKVSGHLTGGQAGELANKALAKQLVLTHLPHYGKHELLLSQARDIFKGKIILASTGLILDV